MKLKHPARVFLPILLVLLATSSCDCEERIRGVLRGSGDRKEVAEKVEKRRAEGESSAPHEEEPNDFPAQATHVVLGGDLRPLTASISGPQDRDWFALTSQNDETWQVVLTVTPKSPAFDPVIRVEVPGSPGAPIEYHLSGPGEPESIPVLAVSGSPQRIMVMGADQTTGDYEISFQKRLSGGSIEAEPNDDIDAATRFDAPGTIEGFYDRPEDRDIFFIPPSRLQDPLYQLQVTPVEGLVQQVRVYTRRDLKVPYLSFQVGPEKAAGLPNLHIPQGTLGVWVVLTAGQKFSRDKSYRLSLLAHPPTEATVEAEPNDTAETAQRIRVGTRLSGYFHTPEDVDHFRVYVGEIPAADAPIEPKAPEVEPAADAGPAEAPDADVTEDEDATPPDPLEAVGDKTPAGHIVRVTAVARRENARIGLAAPGQGRETVRVSEPGAEVVLCNRPVESGYLAVELRPSEYPDAGLQNDFDYDLITEDVAKLPGIEIEPNNSPAQADKLLAGQKRVGFVAGQKDVDVFAFAVPFPPRPTPPQPDSQQGVQGGLEGASPPQPAQDLYKPRTVEIVLGANPANLGFELRDDEAGLIARVDRAGAGGEERLKIDLPPGLYFVQVSGTQTEACKPYELSYSLLP